jgi:hypothetical protein
MAGVLELIWVVGEAEYFSGKDWTTQITLIPHENFAPPRNGPHRATPGGASRWAQPTHAPVVIPGRATARTPMCNCTSTNP